MPWSARSEARCTGTVLYVHAALLSAMKKSSSCLFWLYFLEWIFTSVEKMAYIVVGDDRIMWPTDMVVCCRRTIRPTTTHLSSWSRLFRLLYQYWCHDAADQLYMGNQQLCSMSSADLILFSGVYIVLCLVWPFHHHNTANSISVLQLNKRPFCYLSSVSIPALWQMYQVRTCLH